MKNKKTLFIIGGIIVGLLICLTAGYYLYGMLAIANLPCGMSVGDTHLTDAYMSFDREGKQRTTVFVPSDKSFYTRLVLRCAVVDTKVRAELIAVKVLGEPPNEVALESNYVLSSKDITGRNTYLWFQFGPNDQLWPPGQYLVNIYLEDGLKTSINFQVK